MKHTHTYMKHFVRLKPKWISLLKDGTKGRGMVQADGNSGELESRFYLSFSAFLFKHRLGMNVTFYCIVKLFQNDCNSYIEYVKPLNKRRNVNVC